MKTREAIMKERIATKAQNLRSMLATGKVAKYRGSYGRKAAVRMVKTQIGPYYEVRTYVGNFRNMVLKLLPSIKDVMELLEERNYLRIDNH
jgi:hypothetical protein